MESNDKQLDVVVCKVCGKVISLGKGSFCVDTHEGEIETAYVPRSQINVMKSIAKEAIALLDENGVMGEKEFMLHWNEKMFGSKDEEHEHEAVEA